MTNEDGWRTWQYSFGIIFLSHLWQVSHASWQFVTPAQNTLVTTTLTEGQNLNYGLTISGNDGYTQTTISLSGTNCGPFSAAYTSASSPNFYGAITNNIAIDYDSYSNAYCTIVATNTGGQVTTATISISVVAIVNELPIFTSSSSSCAVDEEQPENTQLSCGTQLAFTDGDGTGDTWTCQLYSATSSTAVSYFKANYFKSGSTHTCVISTTMKLDREKLNPPAGGDKNSLQYGLSLKVIDSAGLVTTTTMAITITLTDIDDNGPICRQSLVYVSMQENTASSTLIYTMNCPDPDSSTYNTVTYANIAPTSSYVSFTTPSFFTTSTALDYDQASRDVSVFGTATSTTRTAQTMTISIIVTPMNDNTPTRGTWSPTYVASPSPITSIAENAPAGTVLFTASYTDADLGNDGVLTYSLTAATAISLAGASAQSLLPYISIDNTGQVKLLVANKLDRETMTQVEITVKVTDMGTITGPRTASDTVRVSITDINEFPPTIVPTYKTVSIPEAPGGGLVVATFAADDPDASLTVVKCSINSGNTLNLFTVDTGDYKTIKTALGQRPYPDSPTKDPTSYNLQIICGDNNLVATSLTSTAYLQINVNLYNNNTPSVSVTPSPLSIPENQAVGKIADIAVTDLDAGVYGNVNCSLLGSYSDTFQVTSDCSQLQLIGTLDYDNPSVTPRSYTLVIQAKDGGSLIGFGNVTLSVTDVNDNPPSCVPTTQTKSLIETSPVNTAVVSLNCTDVDSPLFYAIQNSASYPFSITTTYGGITTNAVLDYDAGPRSYPLTITVKEDVTGGATVYAYVFVYVTHANEFTPSFASVTSTFSVAESLSAGSIIGRFAAVDNDAAPDNIVSYSIVSVDGSASSPLFSIYPTNGDIYLSPGQILDYDTMGAQKYYVLIVQATDGGNLQGTGTCTISITNVNDNVPKFTPTTVFTGSVSEDGGTTSGTIVTVSATDGDVGAVLTYSKVSGDASGYFSLASGTGVVTRSGTAGLNYDTTKQVTFLVQVTDSATAPINSVTATVIIKVTDYNAGTPTCTPALSTVTVSESLALGSLLLNLSAICSDSDLSQKITYTQDATSTGTYFSVDSVKGNINLVSNLDYEVSTSVSYYVLLQDNGSPVKSSTATLSVVITNYNEFVPICTNVPSSVSVPENTATSATLFTVAGCTDGDKDDTRTFAITAVNGAAGSGPFVIGSSTGIVTLGSTPLDYETLTQYTTVITVTDSLVDPQRFTTSYTVTVKVTNINESPPVLSVTVASATIREDNPVGTALNLSPSALAATDPDRGGTDGTFGFYLLYIDNSSAGYFQVVASSGVIQVARPLDRESVAFMTMYVVARDGGNLQSTATATISVTISDYNDNAPQFGTTQRTVSIYAGQPIDTQLIDFTSDVTDADSGVNAVITLSLPSSPSQFKVTGKRLLTNIVLPQSPTLYTVSVQAADGGTPTLSSVCTVTVIVLAANLNSPLFTNAGNTIVLPENSAVGQIVYTATSSDADPSSPENKRNYTMTSDTSNGYFRMDPTSGQVYLIKALDYETAPGPFNLTLQVLDYGNPPLSSTLTVRVTITDVNDNAPVFAANNNFQFSISENTIVTTVINRVLWSDADSGVNGQVICSIASQTGSNYLTIDPNTCDISINNWIDREVIPFINIVVRLIDKGTPALSSEKIFLLTINDLNDNTPQFPFSRLTVNIDENSAAVSALTNAIATDPDSGSNGQITYSLTGFLSTRFAISAVGAITTQVALDREEYSSYTLLVKATDQGSTPLTGTCTLTIIVNDLNDNSPVISNNPYSASIAESDNIFVNYPLPKIIATDADSKWGVLSYFIVSITPASNNFVIHNATGQLSLASYALFNREDGIPSYTLQIKVQDNGSPTPNSALATVTITITDVNDNTPIFNPSSISTSVYENVAVGSPLSPSTVAATDADASAPNNVVFYYFDSMMRGDPYFSVNTSGVMTVAVASLDREYRNSYVMRIRGVDQGTPSLTGTLTVTINILDVNDNRPIFTSVYFNGSIAENSASGTNILKIGATDADIGTNAVVSYSIDTSTLAGSAAASLFVVSPTTGNVSVNGSLDFEGTKYYVFPVLAIDGGTPSLTGTGTVFITVTDVNDNAPILLPNFYSGEVATIDDGSCRIADVNYTDVDTGAGGVAKFSWATSVTFFNVDPDTGYVTKVSSMALVAGTKYVQYVQAKDQGSPSITSTSSATVRIDAFLADDYVVKITFGVSQKDFNLYQYQIRDSLRNVLSAKYPDNRVQVWKSDDQTSSTLAYVYAVANRYADSASNVTNVTKEFVPVTDLLAMWRLNSDGQPTSPLVGSTFSNTPITKVEPYYVATTTPWYQTAAGIAGLTLGSILAALLLAGAAVGIYFLCQNPAMPYTSMAAEPVPVAKVSPIKPQKIIDLNEAKHPNKIDKVPVKNEMAKPTLSQKVTSPNLEAYQNVYEPSFENTNYTLNENAQPVRLDF